MEPQKPSENVKPVTVGSEGAIISSRSSSSSSDSKSNGNKKKEWDFAEHLESYLARRDGVDKLLKIARYSTKVILASSVLRKDALLAKRLKDFEASVGVSRKAFRLGKFIQDFNALRKVSLNSREGALEIVAYGGEGIYYFVEQFTWLIKAGLIDKRYATKLQKISAWTEFIGYCGSVTLKSIQVSVLLEKETVLTSKINEAIVEGHISEKTSAELSQLREKRVLKMVSIMQDFADGLMALSDIRDGKGALSNPLLLASAGLLSALISSHKNWSAC
eukprot:Gb_16282 [translate_table: standard]